MKVFQRSPSFSTVVSAFQDPKFSRSRGQRVGDLLDKNGMNGSGSWYHPGHARDI